MKIAELFAYIGVVTDEQKLKDFNNMLNEGKNALINIAATATGTSLAFGAMFDKALNTSLALAHFEAQTGLSAQTLQLWQHVGESMGVTADTVTGSIVSLNKQLAMVRLGQGNIAPFQMLGINIGQSTWDVLKQLRGIIGSKAYNPQTISALMEQMGLSAELVKVLKLSNAEFDKLSNRESIITPREMDSLLKFNAALRGTGENITKVFTQLSAQFAPSMMTALDSFNKWFDNNRGNISKTIGQIGTYTMKIANETKGAIEIINKIAGATGGWNTAVVALVGSLALLHPELVVLTLIIDALNELNTFASGKGSWQDKLHNFMSGKGGLISHAVSYPEKLGERIGSNSTFWDFVYGRTPWSHDLGRPMTPAYQTVTPTITQNIYTNASAKEVADISAKQIEKIINNASVQIPKVR
jgi:hypothetical protein